MALPLVNCPDCNSLQRFSPRRRVVEERPQIYIACLQCGYESVLESFTRQEWLQTRRERVHLLRRMRRQIR